MTDDTMMREAFLQFLSGPKPYPDFEASPLDAQHIWQAAIRATAEECARMCDSEAPIEGIAQKCAAEIRNRFWLEASDENG